MVGFYLEVNKLITDKILGTVNEFLIIPLSLQLFLIFFSGLKSDTNDQKVNQVCLKKILLS